MKSSLHNPFPDRREIPQADTGWFPKQDTSVVVISVVFPGTIRLNRNGTSSPGNWRAQARVNKHLSQNERAGHGPLSGSSDPHLREVAYMPGECDAGYYSRPRNVWPMTLIRTDQSNNR